MSNMDPFDEFEFKPLTDGLGFHKKTVTLKEGLKNTGVLDEELQSVPTSMPKSLLDESSRPSKKHSFEDVLSALEKTPLARNAGGSELTFTEPLPRAPEKKQAMEMNIEPVQSPFPQPGAYKSPLKIPSHIEKGRRFCRRCQTRGERKKSAPAVERPILRNAIFFRRR